MSDSKHATASILDNESQITLVNVEPTSTFVITKPSILNTQFLLNGRPCFKVATVDAAAAKTTITDEATGELLATIKRRIFHADSVRFAHRYEGKPLAINDWMKEGKMTNGHKKWTMQTPVGTFIWRQDVEYRFALCPENDLDNPIAHLQLATEDLRPLALIMKRGTETFRDAIITSFVILEQRMRLFEKEIAKAMGRASPGAQFGTAV